MLGGNAVGWYIGFGISKHRIVLKFLAESIEGARPMIPVE
jgi:hypothetical protein